MNMPSSIEKFIQRPTGNDYEVLRQKGLSYIRQLAAQQWTDHNVHDPGIQMLEILCFGLTELGYKTDFDIADILAENTLIDQKLAIETEGQTETVSDSFFSARDILTNAPTTITDWRKVIIDCKGIKNAWLDVVSETEPPIYRDRKLNKLTFTANQRTERLNIDGLFDIRLQFEKDVMLGDLNSWIYEFQLTSSGEKSAKVFVQPIWQQCLQNYGKLNAFDDGYLDGFSSIKDTFLYASKLCLLSNGLAIECQIHIDTPLAKTNDNKNFLLNRLTQELPALIHFIKQRTQRCCELAHKVLKRVNQQRGLCEDFNQIAATEIEEVGVCADIEISAGTDLDLTLARIYLALKQFFSPAIHFKSLQQLQSEGFSSEEIFNGPALDHGFLNDADVHAALPPNSVHVSDIIQILMDIEGVIAVKKIQLSSYFFGLLLHEGVDWCLPVTYPRSLNLNIERCSITFYKGLIPYSANRKRVLERLTELEALVIKARPLQAEHDIEIPQGKHLNLQDYVPLQHEFPLNYAIGQVGLPPSASDLRKAQAKQLKGYLLHAEQIFANFCGQLANVKHLFSLDTRIQRSYFSQHLFSLPTTYQYHQGIQQKLQDEGWSHADVSLLEPLLEVTGMQQGDFEQSLQTHLGNNLFQQHKTHLLQLCKLPGFETLDVAHISPLIKEFVDAHPQLDWQASDQVRIAWQSFVTNEKHHWWQNMLQHDQLLESREEFQRRRNRFLDHIAARFAERFADYVLVNNQIGQAKTPQQLIDDKIAFLQEYPLISRTRGQAFDYYVNPLSAQSADNVSGLKRRICRLLGMEHWQHHPVPQNYRHIFEIKQEVDDDNIDEDRFNLLDDNGDVLLTGTKHYLSDESRMEALSKVLESGIRNHRYRIKTNVNGEFYFHLVDAENDILAMHKDYRSSKVEIEHVIDRCVEVLQQRATLLEGFHLVEHMLLRPLVHSNGNQRLFKVSLKEDCSPGFLDPYSFRITAVVPAWPERFRNMDFRRFFEHTIREQAPAHIHVKICWVDRQTMDDFEDVYFPWLKLKANQTYSHPDLLDDNHALVKAQTKLITVMEQLNSVYPETHLFDCQQDTDESTVLLNHSKLGSSKGN